ncbi:hypothetical protein SAMN04487926_12216 [Paraburkholderia steynii]|uniref:Uncharacterized protein n=1 Tax=Paraburkholderia steynii TaxID=1245441 RepID=A0A7Z7FJU2_9BURK|nr:hypothetical protein SAMN04487926_12216 [Paraburkholderia steynii]
MDVGSQPVYCLMNTHFPEHLLGKRSVYRNDNPAFPRENQPHGFRGTDKKRLLIESNAAMTICVHQASPSQRACSDPKLPLK